MKTNNSFQKIKFDEICKNLSKRVDNPQESEYEKFVGLEHLDTLEPKITRWGSTRDVTSTMTLFKNKQILFGRRNWYLRRVSITNFEGLCSGDIYVLDAIEGKIVKDFLLLLMHTDEFFEKNMMYSHGTMSKRVKWSNLSKMEFIIPQIPEQKKIITLIHQIDDVISKLQNLIKKTEYFRNSRCELLINRGLGHTKFKKIEGLFDKILEIPEEWEEFTLKSLCKTFTKQTGFDYTTYIKPKLITKYQKGALPFIQNKDFENNKTNFVTDYYIPENVANKFPNILLDEKCLLISISGRLGNIGIFSNLQKAFVGGAVAVGKFNDKKQLNWVMLYLQSKTGQSKLLQKQKKAAHKNLILADLRKIKIPLPSTTEQNKINNIISDIDEKITSQYTNLLNLKLLRKSLINSKIIIKEVKTNVTN
jgi:type I restriction enzyme, S subunit